MPINPDQTIRREEYSYTWTLIIQGSEEITHSISWIEHRRAPRTDEMMIYREPELEQTIQLHHWVVKTWRGVGLARMDALTSESGSANSLGEDKCSNQTNYQANVLRGTSINNHSRMWPSRRMGYQCDEIICLGTILSHRTRTVPWRLESKITALIAHRAAGNRSLKNPWVLRGEVESLASLWRNLSKWILSLGDRGTGLDVSTKSFW